MIRENFSPLYSLCAIALLYNIVLRFAPEEQRTSSKNKEKKFFILEILRIPGLFPFLLFATFHWSAHIAYNLSLDIYRDQLGLPFYITGIGICTGICCEIYCMARMHHWLKYFSSYSFWFSVVATCAACRWAILSYPLPSSLFVAIQVLQGFTFGIFFTVSVMYLQKIIPQEILTSGQNIFYITTFSIGGSIGTFICGVLLDTEGKGAYVFLGATILSVCSLIQTLFLPKYENL